MATPCARFHAEVSGLKVDCDDGRLNTPLLSFQKKRRCRKDGESKTASEIIAMEKPPTWIESSEDGGSKTIREDEGSKMIREDGGSKAGESVAMEKLPTMTQQMIDSSDLEVRTNGIFCAAECGYTFFFRSLPPGELSTALSLRDERGRSLLHTAALCRRVDLLMVFAKAGLLGNHVNSPDVNGRTPISIASAVGCIDIVDELISQGADLHTRCFRNGLTPLHYAAQMGRLKVAQILISHGADINVKCKALSTPLHQAAGVGKSLQICEYLIEKGAEIDAVDKAGQTPLTHAVICNHKEAVLLLIKHGADMAEKVEYGILGRYPADFLVEACDSGLSTDDCELRTQRKRLTGRVRLSGRGIVRNQSSSFESTELSTDSTTLDNAKIALSWYNEKSASGKVKRREYELVDVLAGTYNVMSKVNHCNFVARPKNGNGAQSKLFFAEVIRSWENIYCTVCVIIGGTNTKTGLRGCKICERFVDSVQMQHPLRKNGFIKWKLKL